MVTGRRPAARRIEAVERAIHVLDELAAAGELGTNELARRIGAHPSSVSRLLATLEHGELVTYVPATGRYRLGARLADLGHAALARLDLRGLARSRLEALVERTGETATLSVPGERDAVTVDFVTGSRSVVSLARLGRSSAGHATATGKVMLAFGGTLPEGALERFTERTIADVGTLERELEHVRERGWAEADGEREAGLAAVAAPVLGQGGALVAILGLQGPADRFGSAARRAAVPLVLEHAASLSRSLERA